MMVTLKLVKMTVLLILTETNFQHGPLKHMRGTKRDSKSVLTFLQRVLNLPALLETARISRRGWTIG